MEKRKNKINLLKKIEKLVVEGKTNPEIGEKINLSTATVNAYIMQLLEKYECANRVQLAVKIATGK